MSNQNAINAKKRINGKNSQKSREFQRWFPWILVTFLATMLLAVLVGWKPFVLAPTTETPAVAKVDEVVIPVTGDKPSNGLPTATLEATVSGFIPETGTTVDSPRQNDTIPGMNITSWLGTDDSGMLPPGMTAIGDVKVEGKIFYDSGSGEATVVVNTSSREVKIYGEWGASLVTSVDKAALATEVWNSGCDQNNGGCTRIRFVEVTDQGTTEYFVNRPPSQ